MFKRILLAGSIVLLGLASTAIAQQRKGSYDSMIIGPQGQSTWTPWTFTPNGGAVYDPQGFLGHQYINPYGVGNGGIPQIFDTNPQLQYSYPYGGYQTYPY